MKRLLPILFFCLGVLVPGIALGDGIMIPEPWVDMAIGRHEVAVSIQDQAAVTEIDQTFLNLAEFGEVEATYMFPLPEGAAVSAFSMFVDGKALASELLPADEARKIYTDIVRQRIDPALLEYAGRGAYRARIYPVVAGQPKRVQLSYSEVIPERNAVRKYVYPLNTEKFSTRPLEVVSVRVEIVSAEPIKSVYSPSHTIDVQKSDDHHVTVVYADEGITPKTDFVLYYSVSRDDVGMDLLTYRQPGEAGFYMLLAAPRVAVAETEAARKRVSLVLDRSGSMAGDKMTQAREALKFVLRNLNPQDEFNVFDYSTLVAQFIPGMSQVTAETISAAIGYVDGLMPQGGTNIHEALLAALLPLADDGSLNMVLFLTDGLATIGVTDNEGILNEVKARNGTGARIFAFGVGYDVNTHLLDRLGTENRGTSAYVKPGEDIEAEVSAFYAQVSHPVLSGLALDFGGVTVRDVYPGTLPDLFKGSQIVQLGRYDGSGVTTVTLTGTANGASLAFPREVTFHEAAETHDFLPRLWATRKIGFLLDQVRLNGEHQELVDEIVALSRTYGIITPYTSFLIVEDTPSAPMAFEGFDKQSGADAVAASEATRDLFGAGAAPQAPGVNETGEGGLQVVGTKTFYLRDGVWKDAAYQEGHPTEDYRFGSDAYFDLVSRRPELGAYLAVGKEVIVSAGGVVYRIGADVQEPNVGRCDFSGNGRVDFSDFLVFARAYGKAAGQAGFAAACDLDDDGRVGFEDFLVFVASYGRTAETAP